MHFNYLDLGPPRETVPPRVKILLRGARAWWRARKGRLGIIFAEAFSLHVILFISLILTQSTSLSGKKPGSNLDVIRQAIAELSKSPQNPRLSESMKDKIDSLADSLDRAVKFDDGVDKAQKVEIAQYMIQSIARMRAKLGGTFVNVEDYSTDEILALLEQNEAVRLNSGEKAFHAPRGEARADGTREIEFYTLDRSREARIQRLLQNGEHEKESASLFNDLVKVNTSKYSRTGVRSISAEVYFRDCPYEQILARGASLFSVVKGFPAVGISSQSAGGKRAGPSKPPRAASSVQSDLMTVFIIHPAHLADFPGSGSGVLTEFSSERMDQILDDLMKMPDDRQFVAFERDYLRRFDPNSDELARLSRRFISANLNSVFHLADDFMMAFDFVEELFYKRPIYDAFAAYWRLHPRTKTAAEFIFSLADAYDFERRALVFLDAVYDDAGDMLANRSRHTDAFNYKVKAYVMRELADEVRRRLKQSGFASLDAAVRRYREESAALYDTLAQMSGEIRDRARFALGQMAWEDGATEKALAQWAKIEGGYSAPVFQLIRPYLGLSGEALSQAVPKISGFLNDNAVAGSGELLRRHLKYHKWAKRANTLK